MIACGTRSIYFLLHIFKDELEWGKENFIQIKRIREVQSRRMMNS